MVLMVLLLMTVANDALEGVPLDSIRGLSAHFRGAKRRRYCSIRCRNDAYIERRRRRRKKALKKVCQHCGREFRPKRSDARYCSTRCRVAAHRRRKRVEDGKAENHKERRDKASQSTI